jgi:hypothetical protein
MYDFFKNEETVVWGNIYALMTYVSYDYVSQIVYKADFFKNTLYTGGENCVYSAILRLSVRVSVNILNLALFTSTSGE